MKSCKRAIHKIASKYVGNSKGTVILGCTELSLMMRNSRIRKIDTIDVLVDATIRKLCGGAICRKYAC